MTSQVPTHVLLRHEETVSLSRWQDDLYMARMSQMCTQKIRGYIQAITLSQGQGETIYEKDVSKMRTKDSEA
jgi:hypothetical protein